MQRIPATSYIVIIADLLTYRYDSKKRTITLLGFPTAAQTVQDGCSFDDYTQVQAVESFNGRTYITISQRNKKVRLSDDGDRFSKFGASNCFCTHVHAMPLLGCIQFEWL